MALKEMGPEISSCENNLNAVELGHLQCSSPKPRRAEQISLDISNSDLSKSFPNLPPVRDLLELRLSNCKLQSLPICFESAKKLRVLDLSCNFLREIPKCLLNDLRMLKKLVLNGNKLKLLPKLASLHHLRELDVSSNCLEEFPAWILSETYYLITLNLSNNPLFYDTRAILGPSSILRLKARTSSLDLSNTCLMEKHLTLLKYFPTLDKLDMSNYKLCFLNQLNDIPNGYLPSLITELSIRNVNLNTLPDLTGLKSLKMLDVSKNPLSFLPDSLCSCLTLQTLVLSRCSLYSVPEDIGNMVSLQHLDISHNDIISLPISFRLLTNLVYLDLYDNSFCSLPCLDGLTSLRQLDICLNIVQVPTGQLFDTNCTYEELKKALRDGKTMHRIDGQKVIEEVEEEQETSDSETESYSSMSNTSGEHISSECSYSDKEEGLWGETLPNEDNFDPRNLEDPWRCGLASSKRVENPLKDCLIYCPERIRYSPFFYHPAMDRHQKSFFTFANVHSAVSEVSAVSSIEGQFDDS